MGFATVATVLPLVSSIWSGSQAPATQAFVFDAASPRPNVVWVISDELQYPLAFNAEGQVRPELPNLRALSEESTSYTRAYPGANYTDYAVPSMLSGISDVAAQGTQRMQEVRAGIGIVPGMANEYSVVMESPIYRFECKDAGCASVGSDSEASAFERYLGFAKDTAAIAGKTALAAPFSDYFPSLDGKWKDFWSGGDEFGDNAEGNSVGKAIAGIQQAQSDYPDTPFFALWHTIRTHAPWVVDREGKQIFPARVPDDRGRPHGRQQGQPDVHDRRAQVDRAPSLRRLRDRLRSAAGAVDRRAEGLRCLRRHDDRRDGRPWRRDDRARGPADGRHAASSGGPRWRTCRSW